MSSEEVTDGSVLLDQWRAAFVAIHGKNPRKADWLNKAPSTVRETYMSKHGIEATSLTTSTTTRKNGILNDNHCIRLKRPAAVELDFPAKRRKQQSTSLSSSVSSNEPASLQSATIQLNPAEPEEEKVAQQTVVVAATCTDSPTKAALAPFCGVRPVLRRSPRKLPSFGFESPHKFAVAVQRKRPSTSRRNICQLIESADGNEQEATEIQEPDENVPFEGSEQVAALDPKKIRAKRVTKKQDGNFVRLNMRKKTFVRGHTSATNKRKFWNRRRFMNNRK